MSRSGSAAASYCFDEVLKTQLFKTSTSTLNVEFSCSIREKLQSDDELSAIVFKTFKKHEVEYVFKYGQFKEIRILRELLQSVVNDLERALTESEKTKKESCDMNMNDNSSGIDRDGEISTSATHEDRKMLKLQPEAHHDQKNPQYLENSDDSLNTIEFYSFSTPSGLNIRVCQGNIIHQKVEAIVNAANVHLKHGSGVARSIAKAAGRRLVEECDDYLLRNGHALETSEPMHTSAGDLSLPILYVIHVAGPRADRYQEDLNDSVLRTFENVLTYANNVLQVSSVAIPAISSGIYGVDTRLVASCCYKAVHNFERNIQRGVMAKNLLDIYFVNIDKNTTKVMEIVFRSATAQNMSSREDITEELKSRRTNSTIVDDEIGSVHRHVDTSVTSSEPISSVTAMTGGKKTDPPYDEMQSPSNSIPVVSARPRAHDSSQWSGCGDDATR